MGGVAKAISKPFKKVGKAVKKVVKTVAQPVIGAATGLIGSGGNPLGALTGFGAGLARAVKGDPLTLRTALRTGTQGLLGGGLIGGAAKGIAGGTGALGKALGAVRGGIGGLAGAGKTALGGLGKIAPLLQAGGQLLQGGQGVQMPDGSVIPTGGGGLSPISAALGGSLIGLGAAQSPDIPQISLPTAAETDQAIADLEARQAEIDQRFLAGEATAQDELERESLQRLKPLLEQERGLQQQFLTETQQRFEPAIEQLEAQQARERQERIQELTTGREGEVLRRQLNRLGLLDSGALNEALAERFGQLGREQASELARQRLQIPALQQQFAQSQFGRLQELSALPTLTQQALAEQGAGRLAGIRGSQFDFGRGLRTAGLERQFGLQDLQAQLNLERALEEARQRGQRQRALIEAGAGILGQGAGGAGGLSPIQSIGGLLQTGGNLLTKLPGALGSLGGLLGFGKNRKQFTDNVLRPGGTILPPNLSLVGSSTNRRFNGASLKTLPFRQQFGNTLAIS